MGRILQPSVYRDPANEWLDAGLICAFNAADYGAIWTIDGQRQLTGMMALQGAPAGNASSGNLLSNADYQALGFAGPITIVSAMYLKALPATEEYPRCLGGSLYGGTTRGGLEIGILPPSVDAFNLRVYAVSRSSTYKENQTLIIDTVASGVGETKQVMYRVSASASDLSVDTRVTSAATSGLPGSNNTDPMEIGTDYTTGKVLVPYLYRFNAWLSFDQWQELQRNPWQVWKQDRGLIYSFASGGASAALDGSATAQSTAAGALTTSIPVTAAAAVVATASGALSTAILLSGQAASASVVGGVLTTTITLSGSALSEAIAQAALSTDIKINGTAGTEASSSGELTTGSILTGSAGVVASSVASLTTNISLSGAAISQVIAAANLTDTPLGLSGDATVQASATGELLTDIPLIGSAQAYSTVIGGLTTIIPLSGAAASVADATGNLTLETTLSGASIALALAGGNLTTVIRLDGTAIARAAAIGLLSTPATEPVTPPCRIIMVKSDARVIQIQKELRAMLIPIDRRTIPVSRC